MQVVHARQGHISPVHAALLGWKVSDHKQLMTSHMWCISGRSPYLQSTNAALSSWRQLVSRYVLGTTNGFDCIQCRSGMWHRCMSPSCSRGTSTRNYCLCLKASKQEPASPKSAQTLEQQSIPWPLFYPLPSWFSYYSHCANAVCGRWTTFCKPSRST